MESGTVEGMTTGTAEYRTAKDMMTAETVTIIVKTMMNLNPMS
jgi:hypothetical protein